jgi:hypothetical protein
LRTPGEFGGTDLFPSLRCCFMPKSASLKRSLGLPMIMFYGLGTIVGGGFYALVGKVKGAKVLVIN